MPWQDHRLTGLIPMSLQEPCFNGDCKPFDAVVPMAEQSLASRAFTHCGPEILAISMIQAAE